MFMNRRFQLRSHRSFADLPSTAHAVKQAADMFEGIVKDKRFTINVGGMFDGVSEDDVHIINKALVLFLRYHRAT